MPLSPHTRRVRTGAQKSVEGGLRSASRSRVGNLIDMLSIGQFVTAGIAGEMQRRSKGLSRTPMHRAVLQAIKERKSYSDITGNVATGLTLDILLDPITYGAVANLPFALAQKIGKSRAAVRSFQAVSKFTEERESLRKFKNALGEVFGGPDFRLKKENPGFVKQLKDEMIDRVHGEGQAVYEDVMREFEQLVPDEKKRRDLLTLIESEPIDPGSMDEVLASITGDIEKLEMLAKQKDMDRNSRINEFLREGMGFRSARQAAMRDELVPKFDLNTPEGMSFMQRFQALSENEREFFYRAKEVLRDLEQRKIEYGGLTAQRAAGFLFYAGHRYVPRHQATRDFTLARLKEIREGLKRNDPALDGFQFEVDEVREWIEQVEKTNQVLSQSEIAKLDAVEQGALGIRSPRFLRKSDTKEIAIENLAQFELDAAKILAAESAEVIRAEASRRYVKGLLEFMESEGLIFDRSKYKTTDEFFEAITERLGTKEGMKRIREGFKPVKAIVETEEGFFLSKMAPGKLKGKVIPKTLANEINKVIKAYSDPHELQDFLNFWTRGQNIWKAWTLAIFPSYHARNHISNMWNNHLAGMGIRDLEHYSTANTIMWRGRYTRQWAKNKVIGKYTDEELYRIAREKRVVHGGEVAGEMGMAIDRYTTPTSYVKRIIDPASNILTRKGYEIGRYIEDSDRLAHFLWRLSKGDDVDAAARSVHKYLFDYTHGLSPIEQKLGRNFALPFYAWTRFNLPLQLEMLARQPQKFARAGKIRSAIEDQWGGPNPEEVDLQQWLKDTPKVRIAWDADKGIYKYFSLDNWWPGADIGMAMSFREFRQQALNLWSPFMKMPVELSFNHSFFKGKAIAPEGEPFTTVRVPLPRIEKGKLTAKPVRMPVPALFDHAVRHLRFVNETDRVLKAIDEDDWVTAFVRPILGRAYPTEPKRQRQWWKWYYNKKISYMKGRRTRIEKRIKKGSGTSADRINVYFLTRKIKEGEELRADIKD